MNESNVKRHLSWVDKAFEDIRFRNLLDEIVGFKLKNTVSILQKNVKQKTEVKTISKKTSAISTLRSEISAGRVIRVPVMGGFVWKRVK